MKKLTIEQIKLIFLAYMVEEQIEEIIIKDLDFKDINKNYKLGFFIHNGKKTIRVKVLVSDAMMGTKEVEFKDKE